MVPVLWPIVERALIRYLPERQRGSALGDLREDYEKQRASRGVWRSELWLLRESASLVAAYRAARRGASVATLPTDIHRETTMRSRARNLVEHLWKDARHAGRGLRRSPGFTAAAVLTLALGIGATTAIFSVVYGVLLKPLPFHEPDRLVALYHVTPGPPQRDSQSDATYFTYRDNGRVFEDIGLWNTGNVSVIRNGAPEQVRALRVTDGMLSLLGVHPHSAG